MAIDNVLAFPEIRLRLRLSDEERRRRRIRDVLAWVAVALLHLVFLSLLVISLHQNLERVGRRGAVEAILDLSLLNRSNAQREDEIKAFQATEPDLSAKPLTVIPTPPVIPQSTPSPGDVMKSVGQALACGASNFEYLNKAQQAHCPRVPWQGLQLPNGTIVLAAPPKPLVQQPLHLTGAEDLGHQMQTNSGCPIMLNTPCLQDMFTGNNSANPGTPAH